MASIRPRVDDAASRRAGVLTESALAAAEARLESQRTTLGEPQWCRALGAFCDRLVLVDRHSQAEEWLREGLRQYPQNVPLKRHLARLARFSGRIGEAIALLRQALATAQAQGEPTVELWLQLSGTALYANPGLARRAAERASQEGAGSAETRDVQEGDGDVTDTAIMLAFADVEAAEGSYAAAERRYRRVLSERSEDPHALGGLGQLCMRLGRMDDAVALFERLAAVDPGRGQTALMQARRFPNKLDMLDRLEALARRPSAEGSIRTGLLFQLASAHEQRGDYKRAFVLADDANRVCRARLNYDPAAHRQRCARVRHAFPRELFERRSDCGVASTLPIFVVGMPRSGTSLVEQILAGHSRIHGAGELGTLPRVIAGLNRWERQTGSGRRYPDCVDDIDPHVSRGIADEVLGEMRAHAPDAAHVVDKLPHNFENIGLIRLLLPQARIVSVRRDPRDVAVSNYFTDFAARHGGMGFAYDLDWIGEQLADHNLMMHHWQHVFADDILEVDYETLLEDPEGTARRLLDYVGVPFEPGVLDFHALNRPVHTASLWQVRQPLYSTSVGRWRRYRTQIAPLIAACNREIGWEPIDMVTLPEPGWLNQGVDRYRRGDLDGAEGCFRRLLSVVPEHAAAQHMLGLVMLDKGHARRGIELLERAHEQCPWRDGWREDLASAYLRCGREPEADALEAARGDVVADSGVASASHAVPRAAGAVLPDAPYLFTTDEVSW